MAEMPSSLATTDYGVGSPSKFDITVFPNASTINVIETDSEKKKIIPPNVQLRPLDNIPQPMIFNEDEEHEPATPQPMIEIPRNYTNPTRRNIILRYIATVIGIISALILFIGMCTNDTANSNWNDENISLEIKCGFTHLWINDNKSEPEFGGAFVCLLFMIISFILCIVGIVYVEPCKIMTRNCLPRHLARFWFIMAFVFVLTSIISVMSGDALCLGNDDFTNQYDPPIKFSLGSSIICDIIALVLLFVNCLIAM
eukprot:330505_1